MKIGIIELQCPFCLTFIRLNLDKDLYHSKEFGWLCSKECYEKSELAYARMILGKDTENENFKR